jgi:hypothetical protein
MPSLHAQQPDVEDERRVRWNGPSGAIAAVCQVGRKNQPALSSDSHAWYTLIPASDDLAGTHDERITRQRIELCALTIRPFRIVQPPSIGDRGATADARLGACADDEVGLRVRRTRCR